MLMPYLKTRNILQNMPVFSGSPVYADSDKIIGIVTDILDSHIGFISIKSVENELKALNVTFESDYAEFQEVSYGRNESIKKTV